MNLFLVLSSTSNRNTLFDKLVGLPEVQLEQIDLVDITQKWQSGEVSNYDYLMCLNLWVDHTVILVRLVIESCYYP